MYKHLIVFIFLSNIFSSSLSYSVNSDLDWDNGKIVDRSLNDPESSFPIKNFVINLEENESISLTASINSKSIFYNQEKIDIISIADENFAEYQKKYIESTSGEIVTYFISEPMYMRGVRILQISVLPFQYKSDSKEYILYNDMDLNIEIFQDSPINSQNPILLSTEFDTLISSFVDN